MTSPKRTVDEWLAELRKRGGTHREIAAADLYHGIEQARLATQDRRYGEALEIVEGMARAYPSDHWLASIQDEAAALLVTAEEHISHAEVFEDKEQWESAYAEYQKAVKAYDHHPGLWPLVFYFMSGWLLSLSLGKQGKAAEEAARLEQEIRRVEALRDEVSSHLGRVDPRMALRSMLGWGALTLTMEEPWPGVVKAFCDSRPSAKVFFTRPTVTARILEGTQIERLVADSIRSRRPTEEVWEIVLGPQVTSDRFPLRIRSGNREAPLELPARDPAEWEASIAAALLSHWPEPHQHD